MKNYINYFQPGGRVPEYKIISKPNNQDTVTAFTGNLAFWIDKIKKLKEKQVKDNEIKKNNAGNIEIRTNDLNPVQYNFMGYPNIIRNLGSVSINKHNSSNNSYDNI